MLAIGRCGLVRQSYGRGWPPSGEGGDVSGLQLIIVAVLCLVVVGMGVAARYGVSRRAVIAEIERELGGDRRQRDRDERAA